ncbi:MAG: hypothetical protein OEU92_10435 [Alphaproteobacteria bacterium]|nr:hypothetical protein [Alphaproteobacteria bacterium]
MHLQTSLAAVFALLILSACAKPTPYQAAQHGGGHGYSEQAIGKDQYRIGFNGNGITTRKTVDLYLLYRAAELTEDKGFDYFIVGDRKEYIDPQGLAGRQSQISFARRQELLIGSGIRARFGEEIVDHYGAEIDILMQKGEVPESANVHRAVDVLARSKAAIIRAPSET